MLRLKTPGVLKACEGKETWPPQLSNPGVVSSVALMNGLSQQTGVYTDHCNYGVLGESSFLCRFICHINKGISSTYGGRWQPEKFEKINEVWQCCTWGGKVCCCVFGVVLTRSLEEERWREAGDCCRRGSYVLLPGYRVTLIRSLCDLLHGFWVWSSESNEERNWINLCWWEFEIPPDEWKQTHSSNKAVRGVQNTQRTMCWGE